MPTGKVNQELEINERIIQTWTAYRKLKDILQMNIPLILKAETNN